MTPGTPLGDRNPDLLQRRVNLCAEPTRMGHELDRNRLYWVQKSTGSGFFFSTGGSGLALGSSDETLRLAARGHSEAAIMSAKIFPYRAICIYLSSRRTRRGSSE